VKSTHGSHAGSPRPNGSTPRRSIESDPDPDSEGEGGFASLKRRAGELFAIDPRTLALLRILLALYILVDLAHRSFDMEAFYTDFGAFPREEFGAGSLPHWSFHAWSGDLWFQALLFAASALAALALLAGHRTQTAALVSWALAVSLHNRNGYVQIGGDRVFRLVLFWSLFLPLGRRWSLDALRGGLPADIRQRRVLSVASVALLLQVFLIYPFTVAQKMQRPNWQDLSEISRVLAVDGITTPLGRLLRGIPRLHGTMTAVTVAFEAAVPALVLLPSKAGKLRAMVVFTMWGFHVLVLGGSLSLGLFPFAMVVAWSVFLPSWFWDHAVSRAGARARAALPRWILSPWRRLFAWLGRLTELAATLPLSRATAPTTGGSPWWPRITAAFVLACGALVAIRLGGTLDARDRVGAPKTVRLATDLLRLEQSWELYTTAMTNRYYVYAAQLADGSSVDLHRDGAPLDWGDARDRSSNNRWWKYQLTLSREPDTFAPTLSAFLVRDWDRAHPHRRVRTLDLVMLERPHGMRASEASHMVSLWHHEIDDGPEAPLRGKPARRGKKTATSNEDWIGRTLQVVLTVPPGHFSRAACASTFEVDGHRCELVAEQQGPRVPGTQPPLLPFARLRNGPILAVWDPASDPVVNSHARFKCDFSVRGEAQRPRVRWEAEGPLYRTSTGWLAGLLTSCQRIDTPPKVTGDLL
jgi:hypothetical protein